MKSIVVLLAASVTLAAAVQSGFDPLAVVRQIHGRRAGLSSGDGELSGEFLVDTSITSVPAAGNQYEPTAAFDGTNSLVVWADYRDGIARHIYGARVTPAGTVLDPAGIVVSAVADSQRAPAIAFDGSNFLAVWTDYRDGSVPNIYGARVTPAGTVLDTAGFVISAAANKQYEPAVAFDGTNYLVLWTDLRSGHYEVYGARVTPTGAVLDTSGIGIAVSVGIGGQSPTAAFDGVNYLVLWEDGGTSSDVYGTRVTRAGTVLDPTGIVISSVANEQCKPAVAFDGTNYLAVWRDTRNIYTGDLYGARVTPAGAVLDPAGIAVCTATQTQTVPAVAFDGTNFMVTWLDFRNGSYYRVYGARVTPTGTVLDPSGIRVSGKVDWCTPAIAFDGTNSFLVWQDYRNDMERDIYGARVTPAGVLLDTTGVVISTTAGWQYAPAVASGGTDFLVVWEDYQAGSWDIYGARVTPAGTVLDPTGIAISAGASWRQYNPAVAFDGTDFLVVWEDNRSYSWDIYGARVTPAGAVLDPAGIAVSTAADFQRNPAVSFDGAHFLVVWEDYRSGTWDICGARVTPAGAVLDSTGIAVSTAADGQQLPVVASNSGNSLVLWEDCRSASTSDIYGARVTAAGAVLDLQGIAISTAEYGQYGPAVTADGAGYFAVWEDRRGASSDIYGARVTAAGAVLDSQGIAISSATYWQGHPATSFDGADFLAVWADYRSGTSSDICGAQVTPSGVVADTFSVVLQGGDQWHPALAATTGGQAFLVYQGWAGTVADKIYNTDRIWGKLDVPDRAGVEERTPARAYARQPAATVIRGVLHLSAKMGLHAAQPLWLLDISGRKVADLRLGANDVSRLASGVYVVSQPVPGSGQWTAKIVLQH